MSIENEERITELEIKIAHQEVLIEDLRSALIGHHERLEILEKRMKILTEELGNGTIGKPNVGPGNDKPPHY